MFLKHIFKRGGIVFCGIVYLQSIGQQVNIFCFINKKTIQTYIKFREKAGLSTLNSSSILYSVY